MNIDYDHSRNLHTLTGPQAVLPILFPNDKPASLLDVGCGIGTWLKAALDFGIRDVFGVDGLEMSPDTLHVPVEHTQHQDLTQAWNLKRRFDAVLCFEVAEHLDDVFAPILIDTLVTHGDLIYFSAACLRQPGQHHVNCQWPAYWQRLFNERGYVCSDLPRWQLWEMEVVEPWYKQNMFTARRAPAEAGTEPRIRAIIHPQMMDSIRAVGVDSAFIAHVEQIQSGRMSIGWYLRVPVQALSAKLKRTLK